MSICAAAETRAAERATFRFGFGPILRAMASLLDEFEVLHPSVIRQPSIQVPFFLGRGRNAALNVCMVKTGHLAIRTIRSATEPKNR